MTKFRDLAVGDTFVFQGEIDFPRSGIAKGPWVKLTSTTYRHQDGNHSIRCGTVNAEVVRIDNSHE